MRSRPSKLLGPAMIAAAMLSAPVALAQGGAAGQGGLSPDTPVLAPVQPGVGQPGAAPGDAPQPKTPLPPRDTPRAPQPGQGAAGGDGPKTPLPPRDTPRAPQPGQNTAAAVTDWPCVQVKVPTMSYGQMWSGPPLEDAMKSWRDDEATEDLAALLAARRTKPEEAKAAIGKFAAAAGSEKDARLVRLFAGVFDILNTERSQIIAGIERYAVKQRSLSERIKQQSIKIAEEQKDLASQQTPEALKQQEQLNWDTRIYDERQHSLTYVCETPVILEQRAFEIGREIQQQLSQNAK